MVEKVKKIIAEEKAEIRRQYKPKLKLSSVNVWYEYCVIIKACAGRSVYFYIC